MEIAESVLSLVGNTPLVRMSRIGRGLRPAILAKLEHLNPGGSVKDRIGLVMIEDAERLAKEIPGGFQPNQYYNPGNPEAHYRTTGPEIWEQTDGKVTHLVMGVGTGGTVSGAGKYLKEKSAKVQVVGADPEGSIYTGDIHPYKTEGIGEDFYPGTFDPAVIDRWVRVSDRDAFAMARRITREEGILAGESCGTAVVAALTVARELLASGAAAREAVFVVILPDGGRSYLSKLYNDEWMRANGLLASPGAIIRVADLLADRHRDGRLPDLVLARTTQRVGEAIDLFERYGISQVPVSQDPEGNAVGGIVGSITEKGLLDRAYRDPSIVERTVGEVMDRPLPTVEVGAALDEAFAKLAAGAPALVAVEGGTPVGVVSRLDLLEFLAHRRA